MSDPDGVKRSMPSQGARSETLSFILWLKNEDQEMGRGISEHRDVNRCPMFRNVWRGNALDQKKSVCTQTCWHIQD